MLANLQAAIEELFHGQAEHYGDEYFQPFDEFKAALNEGSIRAAEPDTSSPTGWKVNAWVKKGILLGFRFGDVVDEIVLEAEAFSADLVAVGDGRRNHVSRALRPSVADRITRKIDSLVLVVRD